MNEAAWLAALEAVTKDAILTRAQMEGMPPAGVTGTVVCPGCGYDLAYIVNSKGDILAQCTTIGCVVINTEGMLGQRGLQ